MHTDIEDAVATLSNEELRQVEGGTEHSVWYYVAYVVGEAVGVMTSPGEMTEGGWAAWHG
jgi:bacteriocin-like protein